MQGFVPEDIATDINRFRTSKMGLFRRNRMMRWLNADALGKPVRSNQQDIPKKRIQFTRARDVPMLRR